MGCFLEAARIFSSLEVMVEIRLDVAFDVLKQKKKKLATTCGEDERRVTWPLHRNEGRERHLYISSKKGELRQSCKVLSCQPTVQCSAGMGIITPEPRGHPSFHPMYLPTHKGT